MSKLQDEALVTQLPGYSNGYAKVNGVELHYVIGGKGEALFLLPGWPQTWWAYHKLMPELSRHFQVIAIDIRGMGSSEKPEMGYEKKNLARDIFELIQHLGFSKVNVAGHDIGASVAYAVAAQFPQVVSKLILLDTPPIDETIYRLPMMPLPAGQSVFPWWLAFNQIRELPEKLLEGRISILLDYLFDTLAKTPSAIRAFDRAVYEVAYQSTESIRAANGWYQAFPQDVIDNKAYAKLELPVLGLASEGNQMLELTLPTIANHFQSVTIEGSGHFLMEEKPEELVTFIIDFLA